ncbi:helix-turn-helix domain-containing protein [Paenibacillus yanchengensis]|uniref:Helix-turn-helix domain-containing protein n=1 Tax=Paenibacillus yanchengensis TaxID=2035833 RepID=A0ABW4YG84_9BACL
MEKLIPLIGANIRLYRLTKGWTQEQLAEAIGSTGSYIGQLERGEKNFRIETIIKIADALEIDTYALLENINGEYLYQKTWVWASLTLILKQNEAVQRKIYRVLNEMLQDEEK